MVQARGCSRHQRRRYAVLTVALLLTGCETRQSALSPQGPHSESIAWLIRTFSSLLGAIWLLVVIAMLVALFRRRQGAGGHPLALDRRLERSVLRLVSGLAFVTGIVVLALTAVSFLAQAKLFSVGDEEPLIVVTAHQWWWEVQYQDPAPQKIFVSANEIHIPVGSRVRVKLRAADVIHSLWVPELNGKQDLIPGRTNETELLASHPGTFRGQCAEFCGLQHAHMAILVIAEEPAVFESWRNAQLASAAAPAGPEQRKGQAVFLAHACVLCHTIGGTEARGRIGPDLTHIGSRLTLAAGELPLTRGTLAAWIADPQGIKPGNVMPNVPLDADELNAVVGYLENLK